MRAGKGHPGSFQYPGGEMIEGKKEALDEIIS